MANINIGGRLHSTATGNVVTGADEVLDDSKGKKQSVINAEVDAALEGKQDEIADLATIRSGAAAGATAYQKPGTGIPSTDMASGVQTSLGKADSAYQKPSGGIPKTDLDSGVQASLDLADSAVQADPVGSVTPPVTPSDWATAEQVEELEAEMAENIQVYNGGSLTGTGVNNNVIAYFKLDGGQYVLRLGNWTKTLLSNALKIQLGYYPNRDRNQTLVVLYQINNTSSSDVDVSGDYPFVVPDNSELRLVIRGDSGQSATYKIMNRTFPTSERVIGFNANYTIPASWQYNPIPNLYAGKKYHIAISFPSAPNTTVYLSITDQASLSATAIVSLNCPSGVQKVEKDFTPGSDLSGLFFRSYASSAQPSVSVSIIGDDTLLATQETVSEMAGVAIDTADGLSIGEESNGYIKYSDGTFASSSALKCYEIINENYKSVSAVVGASDTVPAAIAFYGANGYMQSASVQFVSGLTSYSANVPDGCTIIRVSNRPATVDSPSVTLKRNNLSVMKEQLDGYDSVTVLNNVTVPSSWKYTKMPIPFKSGKKYYFEVSAQQAVSGSMYVYITPASGSQDANSLLSVTIPTGAKSSRALFVPAQDYATLYFTTYRNTSTPNVTAKIYYAESIERIMNEADENVGMRIWHNPFEKKPLFHHLNVEGDTTVPSQSLPDIVYAKRLGFDVIEANVHKCSDSVYLVKHGNSGALGSGLTFTDGSTMTSATLFADVSSTDIRSQVRYSSPLVQNQTYIPTLDEFCAECKRVGMKVLLQCPNFDVLAIARQYLTDSEIIAYNIPERGDFKGLIMYYGNATGGPQMVAVSYKFGSPFMYGWQDYSSKNESTVKTATKAMHDAGYLVAVAYTNPNWTRVALSRGVDVVASTYKETNPTYEGETINLGDDGLVLNNANYDGATIVASSGGSVSFSKTNNGAEKVTISVRYSGTLSLLVGTTSKENNLGLIDIVSDGGNYVTYSATCERSNSLAVILASASTTIYELQITHKQIV